MNPETVVLSLLLPEIFPHPGFPHSEIEQSVFWRRDRLGKPFVAWEKAVATWAAQEGRDCRHLHISNSHDGAAHLTVGIYAEALAGIGVDMVYLPRLRRNGKDAAYLRQFARRFMSAQEHEEFARNAAEEDEERLRLRVAAHFSLMEAASKACGTGLKIGAGMGRETSLPKQSLGARRLDPEVDLLIEGEAIDRLKALEVVRHDAYWAASDDYLISAVLFWRTAS